MAREWTQTDILHALEPIAEANVNRHLTLAEDWFPHDYVPWDQGRNFAAMGGRDWTPEQSRLSEVARSAMITNLLTEDNLPSYHREIARSFSLDSAWGAWVGRWTAEENRHAVAIRDYLVVTRGVDPEALEQARMTHMTTGVFNNAGVADEAATNPFMRTVAYVTFQELATGVSHRNTGAVCDDPVADRLLERIAADENLHMVFYRNLTAAALDIAPDQTLRCITEVVLNFQMPGRTQPGSRRNAVTLAKYGIYDLRQHLDEVIQPVLRQWRIFQRDDFGPAGEQLRERLAAHLVELQASVTRFEEMRDRALARDARRNATGRDAAAAS